MNWLKKIWNDPVWSTVIGGGIVSLYPIILEKYSSLSLSKTHWYLVLILLCSIIGWGIYKKISTYEYNKYNFLREKDTFNKVLSLFSDSTIYFLRNQDFGSTFLVDHIKPLFNFRDIKLASSYTFINPKLEKLKNELFDNVIILIDNILQNSKTSRNDVIRLHSKISQNFNELQKINEYANNICKSYNQLVKEGYKIGF